MCPDDFTSFEESSKAFDKWLVSFLERNPNSSISEMVDARKQFYIKNGCHAAIERFKEGQVLQGKRADD